MFLWPIQAACITFFGHADFPACFQEKYVSQLSEIANTLEASDFFQSHEVKYVELNSEWMQSFPLLLFILLRHPLGLPAC